VTVTGPPALIWLWNSGIAEPEDPTTLPNRTAIKRVFEADCDWRDLHGAFTGPHDIGGTYGLVGGNENTTFNAIFFSNIHDDVTAYHIVKDRLPRIHLNQGNMLAGSGMENNLGPVMIKNAINQAAILHTPHRREYVGKLSLRAEFHFNAIEVEFRALDQDQSSRLKEDDLAAQFGADRAACPGHGNRLTCQIMTNPLHVQLHRRTAEQILKIDRP